jgi:hypothetical protein
MKSNCHTIRWVRLVGALMMSCLAPNTEGADLVGQEITNNAPEPEYYQIPKNLPLPADYIGQDRLVTCRSRATVSGSICVTT